jgi:hypothetical protein
MAVRLVVTFNAPSGKGAELAQGHCQLNSIESSFLAPFS